MQAKPGVLDLLNNLLTIELTAINQYFVQGEMCKNWGYERLYAHFFQDSREEMDDAQRFIRHILYLDGVPNLQRLNQIGVGENVPEDLQLDLQLERGAVQVLTDSIRHCTEVGDFTTRGMLETMVASEEKQIDWLETQLGTIDHIGLQNYLSQQLNT
jgi:bacterioferritin